MRTLSLLLGALFLLTACASSAPAPRHAHERLHATLYVQRSAEYRAACIQTFRTAAERLAAALADPQWSALPSQKGDLAALPPAVILDIDETVLDNSPYFGQLVRTDTDFDLKQWNRWVVSAQADLVPGAGEFIAAAHKAGVTVFFVTNRDGRLEGHTRLNLMRRGIALDPALDTLLALGERPEWRFDKQSRRDSVALTHRVLLSIGDDLGDFVTVDGLDEAARKRLVEAHAAFWGVRWFALPNALYGSWLDGITKEARDDAATILRKREAVTAAPVISDEEMQALSAQPLPDFPRQQNVGAILKPAEKEPAPADTGTGTTPEKKEEPAEATPTLP